MNRNAMPFLPAALAFGLLLSLPLPLFAQDEPALPTGLGEEEQEEPALPAGLQDEEEPGLPAGLKDENEEEPGLPEGLLEEDDEPALPAGLEGDDETEEPGNADRLLDRLDFELNGFLEARAGYRVRQDRYEKDMSIGESRLQLELEKAWSSAALHLTGDILYDHVADHRDIRLEKGEGWLDLREASLAFSPVDFMDIEAGRQILTWGTGDLLFINDLFPKDWNSFFIGRDEEYLKAPSDAVKGSFFGGSANLDVVYTPRLDADRFIDGRRISFWNAGAGRRSGDDLPVRARIPNDWLEDDEIALRLYTNLGGHEIALYGYNGFWKSPAGQDVNTGQATFPALTVVGASARGNVARGIGNIEAGYYHSRDDSGGGDPMIRNSELRFLAGYEQEIARDLTAGFQYYIEWMMDHGDYERSLPRGMREQDELRHVATVRLTQLLMGQNLELSLFTFYSPSDSDAYLRPQVSYKVNDSLTLEAGGNVFAGNDSRSFFGQFERNSNIFAGIRYSF